MAFYAVVSVAVICRAARLTLTTGPATPGTTALAGSAEAVPLPDASADAVLVGQAYHWFDRERAHAEVGRVLHPGGTFAPVWNIRDERVGWVAELSRIAHLGDNAGDVTQRYADFGAAFTEFAHATTLTKDEVVGVLHTLFVLADRRLGRAAAGRRGADRAVKKGPFLYRRR
ncbi:methyltransferase domain-containing protein [Micromonospora sp. CNB394]|uniref:methyltransferase domain-containing protein n=1 Tax=Micromonospora sp. CNB394 TaxID=1169151 RepID=UPI001E5CC83A|nr:methyltransferase domain-containing protein [Micromonospora sp. CNB394]